MLQPEKMRELTPFVQNTVYLDTASVSPVNNRVADAMKEFMLEYPLNYGVGVFGASKKAKEKVDAARAKVAHLINARYADEIAFTKNTTEAINTIASGIDFKPGDEVILTSLEHQSNLMPWIRLEKEKGIIVKIAQADKDGVVKAETVESLVTEKTKLIDVICVSNIFGTISPVKEIGKIAKNAGILYMVDSAQSGGRIPLDVQAIGCDFMSLCGRKSMMGPQGTAAIFIRKEVSDQVAPLTIGSRAGHALSAHELMLNPAPYKYEAGVLNTMGVIGLGEAVASLEEAGIENVAKHNAELTQYMIDGLLSIPQVELYGGHDASKLAGIISWNVKGMDCADVAARLGELDVAVASGNQGARLAIAPLDITGVVRTSVHYFNVKSDIDALLDGVKRIVK